MQLTIEQFDKISNLIESGANNAEIRKQIDLSESVAVRTLLFYRYHGKEESYDYLVNTNHPSYTKEELEAITERLYLDNISVDRGAIMFKASRKTLYSLMNKRRQSGKPLATPCELPKFSGELGIDPPDKSKPKRQSRLTGDQIILQSYPLPLEQELLLPTPSEYPKIGTASAPVQSGRCKKKMRNKAVQDQNREQEFLQSIQDKPVSNAETSGDVLLGSIVSNVLGEFPKGIPASQYKPGKGRSFDIDVESEGFENLPIDVQNKAYKIHKNKMEMWCAAIKKLHALALKNHLN